MNKTVFVAIIVSIVAAGAIVYSMRDQIISSLSQAFDVRTKGGLVEKEDPALVRNYLALHLSELSPIKEQFGGKFYITSFTAQAGLGIVAYEDGHNAYVADFMYTVDRLGLVTIEFFVIRRE